MYVTSIVIYLVAMFGIATWRRSRIRNDEDFFVAGRRLPLPLAMATLLATWFGAGTMIVSADEVRTKGLHVTAFEPFGAGLCLVLAGLFFARRLWDAKILTVNDLFGRAYGKKAEMVSALYIVSYFGWIASQLLAMSGILHVFFDLDQTVGIFLVAGVAIAYTYIGGMWSVSLTDAVQVVLLILGLLVLAGEVLWKIGDGSLATAFQTISEKTADEHFVLVPTAKKEEFFLWLTLFISGTFGILPGQDLLQRVFSSKSAKIASRACIGAGVLYITLGCVPVLLGLIGSWYPGIDGDKSVIPQLAFELLSTPLKILFLLTLLSVILSSLDSALLAPSSVFAQNFLRHVLRKQESVTLLARICIAVIGVGGVVFALLGEDAFALLELSYSMQIPMFVAMLFAVYQKRPNRLAGFLTLSGGLTMWLVELIWYVANEEQEISDAIGFPFTIIVLLTSFAIYLTTDGIARLRGRIES